MNSFDLHYHPTANSQIDTSIPDPHADTFSNRVLGFWIYLMTDCILFATLFVVYALLQSSTFGGPSSRDIFSLSTPFLETVILLLSSLSCGFGVLCSLQNNKKRVIGWLIISFLLGTMFIFLELNEFMHLIQEGNSWRRSAFLSSFFTLVGTHGLHVSVGLLWIVVIISQVGLLGLTVSTFRRLVIFSMFWHFLDIIWIFIFTFVYLRGVI